MGGPVFARPIDLTVTIDRQRTNCLTVVFSVRLRVVDPVITQDLASAPDEASGAIFPRPPTRVDALVLDNCGNLALRTLEFAGAGVQTVAVDLPMTECNVPAGDFGRTYQVIVDPFARVAETKETNNRARHSVNCIG